MLFDTWKQLDIKNMIYLDMKKTCAIKGPNQTKLPKNHRKPKLIAKIKNQINSLLC